MKKQEEEKFVINTDYNYKKEIISDTDYILNSIEDLKIDYLKIDKESIVNILKRRNVL